MKNLKLKIWASKSKDGMFHALVEEQTYRGKAFGDKEHLWKASNGITLGSVDYPEWKAPLKTFFVRGADTGKDFRVETLSPTDLGLLQDAVDEYNTTFSDGAIVVKVKAQKTDDVVYVNLEKDHHYIVKYGDVSVQLHGKKIAILDGGVLVA